MKKEEKWWWFPTRIRKMSKKPDFFQTKRQMECPHVYSSEKYLSNSVFFLFRYILYVIQTCIKNYVTSKFVKKVPPAILSFVRFIIMVIIIVIVGPRVVTFSILKIKLGYFINVVCVSVCLNRWLNFFLVNFIVVFRSHFIYSFAYTMSSESNTE